MQDSPLNTWLKPGVNEISLHRIFRHDIDPLDRHAFRRLAYLAHAVLRHWRVANFAEHVVAFDQFTERGVLPIEARYRRKADKELRARRIRVRFARHRDHTTLMGMIVELGLDFVTG